MALGSVPYKVKARSGYLLPKVHLSPFPMPRAWGWKDFPVCIDRSGTTAPCVNTTGVHTHRSEQWLHWHWSCINTTGDHACHWVGTELSRGQVRLPTTLGPHFSLSCLGHGNGKRFPSVLIAVESKHNASTPSMQGTGFSPSPRHSEVGLQSTQGQSFPLPMPREWEWKAFDPCIDYSGSEAPCINTTGDHACHGVWYWTKPKPGQVTYYPGSIRLHSPCRGQGYGRKISPVYWVQWNHSPMHQHNRWPCMSWGSVLNQAEARSGYLLPWVHPSPFPMPRARVWKKDFPCVLSAMEP